MSLAEKHRETNASGRQIIIGANQLGSAPNLTIEGFDLRVQPEIDNALAVDNVSGRCQVIGSIEGKNRQVFSQVVMPCTDHEKEACAEGAVNTRPVRASQLKAIGEDDLTIEVRLAQFVPFIVAAAAFEKQHNPVYRKMAAFLTVNQWDISKVGRYEEGPMHVDPQKKTVRGQLNLYHAYIISDCAPTFFPGVNVRPFDVMGFGADCKHQRSAFNFKDSVKGRRTMAHLSFVMPA